MDYRLAFTANGGTAPYGWTLANGSVPPGLVLDSHGVLFGKPTAPGLFKMTVRVWDGAGRSFTKSLPLRVVSSADPVIVTPAKLDDIQAGRATRIQIAATGGASPYY